MAWWQAALAAYGLYEQNKQANAARKAAKGAQDQQDRYMEMALERARPFDDARLMALATLMGEIGIDVPFELPRVGRRVDSGLLNGGGRGLFGGGNAGGGTTGGGTVLTQFRGMQEWADAYAEKYGRQPSSADIQKAYSAQKGKAPWPGFESTGGSVPGSATGVQDGMPVYDPNAIGLDKFTPKVTTKPEGGAAGQGKPGGKKGYDYDRGVNRLRALIEGHDYGKDTDAAIRMAEKRTGLTLQKTLESLRGNYVAGGGTPGNSSEWYVRQRGASENVLHPLWEFTANRKTAQRGEQLRDLQMLAGLESTAHQQKIGDIAVLLGAPPGNLASNYFEAARLTNPATPQPANFGPSLQLLAGALRGLGGGKAGGEKSEGGAGGSGDTRYNFGPYAPRDPLADLFDTNLRVPGYGL